MNHHLIKQIEQKLGLLFINEKRSNNLCFVSDNDSLKDEFKITFTTEDFHNFLKINTDAQIPESSDEFWKIVKRGQTL